MQTASPTLDTSAAYQPSVTGAAADFVGREAELAAFARCRAQAANGQPWTVVVEGESGIGKTALVRRALTQGQDGLQVCWANCDPAEQDYPYGALGQLLHRLPPHTTGVRELIRALTATASPLAVGGDLLAALAAATDTGPLALVVDDVPWADTHSVQTLAFVMRRLYTEPVLLVLTARSQGTLPSAQNPTAPPDWKHTLTRGTNHILSLDLTGLTAPETDDLAKHAGAPGLTPAAVARLLDRTAGHPLHLRSLLAQIPPSQLADLAHPLPMPTSLDAVIRHTLDLLPDDARHLVEALAVLNTSTPLPTAAQLAGIDDATHALGHALDSGLVQWEPHEPTTPLRIHHQLQREAIYQTITPSRRQTLHTTAATLVSADDAWAHKVAATSTTDPALAAQLARAAEHQAAAGRHDRAATLLLWAADLAPSREKHEHHLLNAATQLLNAASHVRVNALQNTIQHCAPDCRRDTILGAIAYEQGDLATAEKLLTHAFETARRDNPVDRLRAATWLGRVYVWQGNGHHAIPLLHPILHETPATPATHRARAVLANATAQTKGLTAGLTVLAETGLPDDPHKVPPHDGVLLMYRGNMRLAAGQLRAAKNDLTARIDQAQADPEIPRESMMWWPLAFCDYLLGNWEQAAINAELAVLAAETNDPTGLAAGHAVIALLHANRGHWDQARAHLAQCEHRAAPYPIFALLPKLARLTLAHAKADRSDAVRATHTPTTPGTEPGIGPTLGIGLPLALSIQVVILTAPQTLHTPEELRHADTALAHFDELACPANSTPPPALALTTHWLHARLAAAHGDTPTARDHYQQAAETLATDGDDIPLHRGFAHRDYAHLLLAQGDTAAARPLLQQAHTCFNRLGAAPFAARAASELAATGITTTATPVTGLTDREDAVAHLAAHGLTNQEIGHELYISPKTVEYHLGHVYEKLGISSRRQLRTTLTPA